MEDSRLPKQPGDADAVWTAEGRLKHVRTLKMPNRTQPQWSVAGTIEAPLDDVWAALIESQTALTPAQKHALVRPDAARLVTTNGTPGAGKIHIDVNPAQHSVTIQGEWWYRGVQTVTPQGRACRLVYQVYNIGPGLGWWAAQLVQGPEHARQMRGQWQAQLGSIGLRLNCETRLETAV